MDGRVGGVGDVGSTVGYVDRMIEMRSEGCVPVVIDEGTCMEGSGIQLLCNENADLVEMEWMEIVHEETEKWERSKSQIIRYTLVFLFFAFGDAGHLWHGFVASSESTLFTRTYSAAGS